MFLLLFRSLSLALIALAPNMLAAGMVLGVMGLAGHSPGYHDDHHCCDCGGHWRG